MDSSEGLTDLALESLSRERKREHDNDIYKEEKVI